MLKDNVHRPRGLGATAAARGQQTGEAAAAGAARANNGRLVRGRAPGGARGALAGNALQRGRLRRVGRHEGDKGPDEQGAHKDDGGKDGNLALRLALLHGANGTVRPAEQSAWSRVCGACERLGARARVPVSSSLECADSIVCRFSSSFSAMPAALASVSTMLRRDSLRISLEACSRLVVFLKRAWYERVSLPSAPSLAKRSERCLRSARSVRRRQPSPLRARTFHRLDFAQHRSGKKSK